MQHIRDALVLPTALAPREPVHVVDVFDPIAVPVRTGLETVAVPTAGHADVQDEIRGVLRDQRGDERGDGRVGDADGRGMDDQRDFVGW